MLSKMLNQNGSSGVLVGLVATLLVLCTIDPAGSYPQLIEGPGITIDESFNVQQGVLLMEALKTYGVFIIDPVNVETVFGGKEGIPYLSDHPPLVRFVLGFTHNIVQGIFPPTAPVSLDVTACARFGSAILFGLTVFLIGATATNWFGKPAGWIAAISTLLMPRLFAHAHLASLETGVNLFYCLAVLCAAHAWGNRQEANSDKTNATNTLRWKSALVPGIMMGLAMLCKIQGFLAIPCIIGWMLWTHRQRAIVPLLTWGIVANIVFFLGWPWLWLDPLGNLQEFLGSATDRATLNCFYLGQVFADTEVPWHYPWVMFLITVPAGLHLLGVFGVLQTDWREFDPRLTLVGIALLFPLFLFSTGVAVYDGARLFLTTFPLWALFIGYGGQVLWQKLTQKFSAAKANAIVGLFLAANGIGLVIYHPCQLSYYNLLVGGLSGAEALGFERTYWQDSLTRSFWQECGETIPTNATISVEPVLHQFQLDDLTRQVPIIREKQWKLVPADKVEQAQYRIAYLRNADLDPALGELLWQEKPGTYVARSRVCLTILKMPSSDETTND